MTILLITAITGGLFYVEMASITLFPALYADICKNMQNGAVKLVLWIWIIPKTLKSRQVWTVTILYSK